MASIQKYDFQISLIFGLITENIAKIEIGDIEMCDSKIGKLISKTLTIINLTQCMI